MVVSILFLLTQHFIPHYCKRKKCAHYFKILHFGPIFISFKRKHIDIYHSGHCYSFVLEINLLSLENLDVDGRFIDRNKSAHKMLSHIIM